MLRLPAVAGQFYPGNSKELSSLIAAYTRESNPAQKVKARACLVPHAGYIYSGAVAGAVFARMQLPKKVLVVGVRHYPHGEALAILSEGAWRTPLGDVPIDTPLALALQKECPALKEDRVAHSREHSLEVQLPFLQALSPGFSFVPLAVGTLRYDELRETGEAVARVFQQTPEEILLVTSSDMNHYENDELTRHKDRQAIACLLKRDPAALYDTCRQENISMCGLGPAVVMLTAVNRLGASEAELVRYANSGEVNGNTDEVVGYAGMIFS